MSGFCTRCGLALDEAGACPAHGVAAGDGQAPLRPRSLWLRATAVLVALVLVGVLGWVMADQRAESRRTARTLAQVRDRLVAQESAANGVSRRVAELETRLNAQPDQAAVAKLVSASVFTVEAGDAIGSAFVIKADGGRSTLITNFHVVEAEWKGRRTQVRLRQEGKQLDATIERVSEGNDLALLVTSTALPALAKATEQPAVGDPVLVVGAPLGLGGSVSNGIVSAYRNGYIQFSAPIAPGNSGGPVVNLRGQVVGVARSKLVALGAEGLSFAIPISLVCTTMSAC